MMINIAPIIRTAPPTPAIIMISLRLSTESVLSGVGELVAKSPRRYKYTAIYMNINGTAHPQAVNPILGNYCVIR